MLFSPRCSVLLSNLNAEIAFRLSPTKETVSCNGCDQPCYPWLRGQAKPPAKAFIGYGGVSVRDAVRDGADWFVKDFKPLIEAIQGSGDGGSTE